MLHKGETVKELPKNIPLLMKRQVSSGPDIICQIAKNTDGEFVRYTYKETYDEVVTIALAFKKLGIKNKTHVAFISDNRREWLVIDLAVLSLGAIDVPRGCDTQGKELRYILSFGDCTYGVFENAVQLKKVLESREEVPLLKTAIVIDGCTEALKTSSSAADIKVYSYNEVVSMGEAVEASGRRVLEQEMEQIEGDQMATIIFTSGTTGMPKGVMLSHRNYTAQLEVFHNIWQTHPGDLWLSILPVWHSYERLMTYIYILLQGSIIYTKPVISRMMKDIDEMQPEWISGVPILWAGFAKKIVRGMKKETSLKRALFSFFIAFGKKYLWAKDRVLGNICRFSYRSRLFDAVAGFIPFLLMSPLYAFGDVLVYKKVRATLGGRLQGLISGGGALQPDIDMFYRVVGIKVLEGYGITEAGPVISARYTSKARPGCVGFVYPSIEVKIVREDHGRIVDSTPLKYGQKGLILVRGEQNMQGYYKRPDLTKQIIDKDGWLNTGDLGVLSMDDEIKITGRAKDTIVLENGENIEPLKIENELKIIDYIKTVVLFGQDKKYLGALIVPDKEAVMRYTESKGFSSESYSTLLLTPAVRNLFKSEIAGRVNEQNGYRNCEKVEHFVLLPEPFILGREISAKGEVKRYVVRDLYKEQIDTLFK